MSNGTNYRTVLVEDRTPGPRGKAPMITRQDGGSNHVGFDGSHHEAVYLAAIIALASALEEGDVGLVVTSPSDHLVEQMNGKWKVGDELRPFHELVSQLASMFPGGIVWRKAPRSAP